MLCISYLPDVGSPDGSRPLHEYDGHVKVWLSLGVVGVGHLLVDAATLDGEVLVLHATRFFYYYFSF